MNLDDAILELYFSLFGDNDNFHSMLYRLISKADHFNRVRLSIAFPSEVLAWGMWIRSEDETEFFKQHLASQQATTRRQTTELK